MLKGYPVNLWFTVSARSLCLLPQNKLIMHKSYFHHIYKKSTKTLNILWIIKFETNGNFLFFKLVVIISTAPAYYAGLLLPEVRGRNWENFSSLKFLVHRTNTSFSSICYIKNRVSHVSFFQDFKLLCYHSDMRKLLQPYFQTTSLIFPHCW